MTEAKMNELYNKVAIDIPYLLDEIEASVDYTSQEDFRMDETNFGGIDYDVLTYLGSGIDRSAFAIAGESGYIMKIEGLSKEMYDFNLDRVPDESPFRAFRREYEMFQYAEDLYIEDCVLENFGGRVYESDFGAMIVYFQESVDVFDDISESNPENDEDDWGQYYNGELIYCSEWGPDIAEIVRQSGVPSDKAEEAALFLDEMVGDIHSANIGVTSLGEMVILDYAGC